MVTTTTSTAPLSTLEAVNQMLQAIGVGEVMSLAAGEFNEDAQEALSALSSASRSIQAKGWYFNTNTEFALDPAPDGTVQVPANCTAFVPHIRSRDLKLTERGGRLYSNRDNSFVIGETVYADLTLLMEFGHLPAPFRWYVFANAARAFVSAKRPEAVNLRFSQAVLDEAEMLAIEHDQEQRNATLDYVNPHFYLHRRR